MKEKEENMSQQIITDFISMLPERIPDYSTFKLNPTKNKIAKNYKEISESRYNKNLSDTVNFPIKTEEEFYIFTFCHINNKFIKNPARTKNCLHIEFMEAKDLFMSILEFGICPICKEISEEEIDEKDKIGVDTIYVDECLKEIFKKASNQTPDDFGFGFDLIILNKHNLKWRPFIPDSTYEDTEILINENKEENLQITNFNEKNRNYIELLEMNKFLSKNDSGFDRLINNLDKIDS